MPFARNYEYDGDIQIPRAQSMGWKQIVTFSLVLISSFNGSAQATADSLNLDGPNAPVVMLSLDGFRADYLQRGYSPNLARVANAGLRSDGLVPVFPSSTFTNHYSIVTGLYPGRHGIIGNTFYDRARSEMYRMTKRTSVEDGQWYLGEPLWVAVEKAGGIAASYFWVGSEADIQGIRPTHYKKYDGRVKNSRRVQQVLNWLQLPKPQRPNLITMYFSDVDSAGHNFGPDSPEVNAAIAKVDTDLGHLLSGLEELPFAVNLVITSDHGMAAVSPQDIVFVEDYIDLAAWNSASKVVSGGAYIYFYSKNNNLIETSISSLKKLDGLTVHRRGAYPEQIQLGDGPRTPDFIATIAPPGYLLLKRPKREVNPPAGAHGYLPRRDPRMLGIFYANGPDIRPGRLSAFENVHVYPYVRSLLGLPPAQNIDGDPRVLAKYLR